MGNGHGAWAWGNEHGAMGHAIAYWALACPMSRINTIDAMHIWQTNGHMAEYGGLFVTSNSA